MLKAGMAWHFSKYDDTLEYQEAEVNSRLSKIGLWADPQRIAPWDFRKK
jgi:endonuclease YncB( thermonuclease family)